MVLEDTEPTYDHRVERKKSPSILRDSKENSHRVSTGLGLGLGGCNY